MASFPLSAGLFIVFGSVVLAGCTPAARRAPAPVVPVVTVPSATDPALAVPGAIAVDPTPGLNDREPDTCKAADHVALLGQPGSAAATAAIAKPVRIVAPGMIVDQEEYDSFRVNFYLNDQGVIVRMNCG
ncbi:I78 family peptidase inhibitor [Aliigemmobacter aestuarii]|nr:I78 family peptidase inhibitor [Gemmobacter aestuarii]